MQNLIVLLILSLWTTSVSALHISVRADDWPDSLCQVIEVTAYYQIGTEDGEAEGEISRPGGEPAMISVQWCPGIGGFIPFGAIVNRLKVILSTGVDQNIWLYPPLWQDDCSPSLPYELPPGTFNGCEAMDMSIADTEISLSASDWLDSSCRPFAVTAHWQTQTEEGSSIGALIGPADDPLLYGATWSAGPGISVPEIIPDQAMINRLVVWLLPSGLQYVDFDPPLIYIANDMLYECPPETFDGCVEMTALDAPALPQTLSLEQNYPNPFNPSTTISFHLPFTGQVQLVVCNLLGQRVAEIINDQLSAGDYEFQLDASNLSSGIYLYTLIFDDRSVTKRMLLLK